MQTSKEGLMAIIGHEGIVTASYKDSVGVWTIGIGHTAAAGWPDPKTYTGDLTVSEAFALFRKDVAKYEAAVAKAVRVPLKQHEFDALVSFHYNTGAIGRAGFVQKLNAGDRVGAIRGFMDWKKPPEIIPRRTAERDLFKTGKYPAPYANVYPAKNGKVLWGSAVRVDLRTKLDAPPLPSPKPVEVPKPAPSTTPEPIVPKPSEPIPPRPSTGLGALLAALFSFVFRR